MSIAWRHARGSLTLALFVTLIPMAVCHAHGMERPGPHGGFIRMPGAFHTELVPEGPRILNVYLLDDEFKRPVTHSSHVKASLKRTEGSIDLRCVPTMDHFVCALPGGMRLSKGDKLHFKAGRRGSGEGLAVYEFPFRWGAH